MKLVLSSAAIIIAASLGVDAADGQRRLRHGVTSEDEAYVAYHHGGHGHHHGGYRHDFNPGPGQREVIHGRTIHGPTCIGECGHGRHYSHLPHHAHVTHGHGRSVPVSDKVYRDYEHYQHAHQPHSVHVNHKTYDAYQHWCDVHGCPEEEAEVVDNFLEEYDKKDIKVIAKFLRSDAYEDYEESEDYN